jgi:hypothetical protein
MSSREWQLETNPELVAQRAALEDCSDVPRQVDHTAFVRKRQLHDFVADLERAGFVVDEVSRGLFRSTVVFSRRDRTDLETANRFVEEICDIVERYDGEYDGWGAFVVTSGQSPESR